MKKIITWLSQNVLYLAWIQAVLGMSISLYFSEILKYPPCLLCWWQRILLYPLVIILAVGIIKKTKEIQYYVLPFSIIGMAVAAYHELLQIGIIPESAAPCSLGVSCTEKYINWFGFVSIPLLSFLAFTFITICMLIFKKFNKNL